LPKHFEQTTAFGGFSGSWKWWLDTQHFVLPTVPFVEAAGQHACRTAVLHQPYKGASQNTLIFVFKPLLTFILLSPKSVTCSSSKQITRNGH
jgi:hypothetical protein